MLCRPGSRSTSPSLLKKRKNMSHVTRGKGVRCYPPLAKEGSFVSGAELVGLVHVTCPGVDSGIWLKILNKISFLRKNTILF